MSGEGAFGGRRAAWLALAAGVSLAASAFLGVYGEVLGEPPSFGADGWSRSAVGHRAFLDLARRLGAQVLVSRHATARQAGDGPAVLLLEPEVEAKERDLEKEGERGPRLAALEDIASDASRLLLVLPKRRGAPEPTHPAWLGSAELVPLEAAAAPLRVFLPDAKVIRPEATTGWHGGLPIPDVDQPQLLTGEGITPLVATDQGILAGEFEGPEGDTFLVLADPDVIATHGLGRGSNALLAARLLERAGAFDGPVLLDETLHGHELQPSIARELLRFPLLLATLQVAVVVALLAWAALVRFGRPRPPPPLLHPGTAFLVESTAALLAHGGDARHALDAYWRAARGELVRLLHPRGEAATDPERALDAVAAARGRSPAVAALRERVRGLGGRGRGARAEAVRIARDVHTLREELTDGAVDDP